MKSLHKILIVLLLVGTIAVAGCISQPWQKEESSNIANGPSEQQNGVDLQTQQNNQPAEAAKIEVTNLYSYVDWIDYLHIFGEVTNKGNVPVKFVDVKMTYKNSKGELAESTHLAGLEHLSPGEKAPFSLTAGKGLKPEGITAEVVDYKVSGEFYKPIKVIDSSIKFIPGGYTAVRAKAFNSGTNSVGLVTAIITFYNGDGKVVEIAVDPLVKNGRTTLMAGDEVSISATVNTDPEKVANYAIAFSYGIYGQGDE